MTKISQPPQTQVSVSVGRQPIFDIKKHVWGYALFCVNSAGEEKFGNASIFDNVAVEIASSTYMGVQHIMQQSKKIMIDFNEKNIVDDLPYAFPPVLAVLEFQEDLWRSQNIPELLEKLKNDGYLLAIKDFSGDPAYEPLYNMADVFCVDAGALNREALSTIADKAGPYPARLLAKCVADSDYLKICHDMGFSLFHGPFFKAPEIITDKQISSTDISRFNLLKIIEEKDPDINKLAKVIQADVSISFRLLSYLNSAAFGFSQSIQSIQKAITLLGWNQIKKWLRVLVLSDMGKRIEAPHLVFLSAQRGKFLESIATDHDYWGFNPDSLFMLGTFSLLDAILGIPMSQIIKHLPVENKIKAALCGEPNNEYLPLLNLARYLEETRWEEGEAMIQNLNLDHGKVKAALQAAVNMANELSAFQS